MVIRVLAIFALPALAALVVFLLLGLLWWPSVIIAVPAALVVAFLLWWRADSAVLARLGQHALSLPVHVHDPERVGTDEGHPLAVG